MVFNLYFYKCCKPLLCFQFGMMETIISAISDEFPNILRHRKMLLTAICCSVGFLAGLPCVTQVLEEWYSPSHSHMSVSLRLTRVERWANIPYYIVWSNTDVCGFSVEPYTSFHTCSDGIRKSKVLWLMVQSRYRWKYYYRYLHFSVFSVRIVTCNSNKNFKLQLVTYN